MSGLKISSKIYCFALPTVSVYYSRLQRIRFKALYLKEIIWLQNFNDAIFSKSVVLKNCHELSDRFPFNNGMVCKIQKSYRKKNENIFSNTDNGDVARKEFTERNQFHLYISEIC